MKQPFLLILLLSSSINLFAQKLLKLESGMITTIQLNSIRMLQTESINHVTISDNQEAKKYFGSVKFGLNIFEVSVYDSKDQSFVWGEYRADKKKSFVLKNSNYSNSDSSEEFELVDGNTTYMVKYRTNPFTGSSWSVMLYFKQPDGKVKTFWGTGIADQKK